MIVLSRNPLWMSRIVAWFPFLLLYQWSNRNLFFTPTSLELTALDRAIPHLEWLLPVYISYLVYVFVAIFRLENDLEFSEVFYKAYLQLIIALCFFVFVPLEYQRPDSAYDGILAALNSWWIWFDRPVNCFPSLHVSTCLLAIQYSLRKNGKYFMSLWGIAIISSTLLCKQHYVIDLIGGVFNFLIVNAVVGKLFSLNQRYCKVTND